MSEEDVLKLVRPNFRDNKIVDLSAAIITGLGLLFYQSIIFPLSSFATSQTYGEILQKVAIHIGPFVLSTLIFFVWKHPLRARWGWLPIAIMGLIILAKINDMIYEATIQERDREPILEGLRYIEIYLFFMPTIILMGLAHYIGMLILARRRKEFA